MQTAQEMQQFAIERGYIAKQAPLSLPCLDEMNKLQQLLYTGLISQTEYEQKRKQLIGL